MKHISTVLAHHPFLATMILLPQLLIVETEHIILIAEKDRFFLNRQNGNAPYV